MRQSIQIKFADTEASVPLTIEGFRKLEDTVRFMQRNTEFMCDTSSVSLRCGDGVAVVDSEGGIRFRDQSLKHSRRHSLDALWHKFESGALIEFESVTTRRDTALANCVSTYVVSPAAANILRKLVVGLHADVPSGAIEALYWRVTLEENANLEYVTILPYAADQSARPSTMCKIMSDGAGSYNVVFEHTSHRHWLALEDVMDRLPK